MAASDIEFGGRTGIGSAALQPTQGKDLYQGSYIDFTNASHNQWAQQFMPDIYEKEINKYGKRTIAGFLKMISAEMPSTSDQIIWTEQGRLHTRYKSLKASAALPVAAIPSGTVSATIAAVVAGTALHFGQTIGSDQPGSPGSITDTTEGGMAINFRVGQTVMIQREGAAGAPRGVGDVVKGIVTAVNAFAFTVVPYKALTVFGGVGGSRYTALVYGSEFGKGTGNFTDSLNPSYDTYSNSPIIMKEHFAINGSDTSQIGWVEVTSENGASGYLWYIKSEHENRLRWEDYQEMAMLEAVPFDGSDAAGNVLRTRKSDFGDAGTVTTGVGNGAKGTQGFFDALEERGNVYNGLAQDIDANRAQDSGLSALSQSFDQILKQLDKQGAIEENMLYVNRDLALAFDNFLATQNNYGGTDGVSWGVFNNSKDTAIDLGFSGFRRGSYDFYKTDWKYLNDWSTRGGFGDIEGVLVPAGSSTVYDEMAGANVKRPFLHVRYRTSEADNRKMKSWITGSVGGAMTTDVDELRMHYLTERCLITQAPNNFFLLQGGGTEDS